MNLPDFAYPPDAIALDLDGTLLNSQERLSKRNLQAIKDCLSHNIPVIIATSRAERSIQKLIGRELTKCCSLVMMNGAIVKGNPPLSGFLKETITPVIATDITNLIISRESGARITIELEGFEFGSNVNLEPDILWQINSATPDMVLSLEESISRIPSKITVSGLGKDLSPLASKIATRFSNDVSIIPSDNWKFLNILSIGSSKSKALKYILASQGISLDNVVAFGDDFPDIEMLSICGIPVSMTNAIPEVTAASKYCTASNDDDGVAIVLEKILNLINNKS
ncbi:MAG: HAD family hydrolase [Chloroflexi bacterium]|nr:HAD family hydrolase [Chloroflexota bacterium]